MPISKDNDRRQHHQQKLGQNTANILQRILDPKPLIFRNGIGRLITRGQPAIQRPLKETNQEQANRKQRRD